MGFIFREEVYQRDREDLRGLAELIVAKQRNGPVGTVTWSSCTRRPNSRIARRIPENCRRVPRP